MKMCLVSEFDEVASTFEHWKEYIINSFNKDEYGKRMSNGRIEGTNGKIKAIKKISFGYDNFYHFRNRIIYIINDDEKPLSFPKNDKQLMRIFLLFFINEVLILKDLSIQKILDQMLMV